MPFCLLLCPWQCFNLLCGHGRLGQCLICVYQKQCSHARTFYDFILLMLSQLISMFRLCDSQPVGYLVEESNVLLRQASGPTLLHYSSELYSLSIEVIYSQKYFSESLSL